MNTCLTMIESYNRLWNFSDRYQKPPIIKICNYWISVVITFGMTVKWKCLHADMEIRVFRCKEFYRITNTVAGPDHSNIIKGEGNRLLNVHLAIFFSHKITFSLSVRYCIVMACQLTGPSRTKFWINQPTEAMLELHA